MSRLLSGITSTGKITLGNYLGAIKNFINLQEENEMYIFVANLHGIVSPFDPKQQKQNIIDLAKIYMACGLSKEKSNLFLQSEVQAQAQLGHILLCHTSIGELSRMTQYKDKSQKDNSYIPTGLLTYPTLMAADILCFQADHIPVGADQKQHIELTRNIAERVNNKYGELFKIPEPLIQKEGAKIMNLRVPTKKMSKSDSDPKTYIALLDDVKTARKKIMTALTDSLDQVKFDEENQPGVSNLLVIHSQLSGISIKDLETKYAGLDYGTFKKDVADLVCALLEKIQERYHSITKDELEETLKQGAFNANKIAQKTLFTVERAMGLKIYR